MIPRGTKRRTRVAIQRNIAIAIAIAMAFTEQEPQQLGGLALPLAAPAVPDVGDAVERAERDGVSDVGGDLVAAAAHQIEERGDGVLLGAHGGGGGEVEKVGEDAEGGGLAEGVGGVGGGGDLRDDGGGVLDDAEPAVLNEEGEKRGNDAEVYHGGAVERVKGDGEESLERVLDGARRGGHVAAEDVDERVDDLALGPDEGAVLVHGGEEAVNGGGCRLDGGGGGSRVVVRDHVRDGVEDATCRHEGFLLGYGEVEECGCGVLLGGVGGGVEGLCDVGDCACVGDYGSGFGVLLRHEAELAEGVHAGCFGDGAELRDQAADGAALRLHCEGGSDFGGGGKSALQGRVWLC